MEERMVLNGSTMPFFDVELTDGVVDLLVLHANKIGCRKDIDFIIPGLSAGLVNVIEDLFKELFD